MNERAHRTHQAAQVPPTAAPSGTARDWSTTRERSSQWVLRLMAWIATTLGRRVARAVLHPIALYFVLFAPGPRQQSARYLQRALGRPARLADVYRHVHTFAATVLDRVYFVRGQLDRFEMHEHGAEELDATLLEGRGAVLLGAHIGSFEALHACGQGRPNLRVAMVMYPHNARMIHGVLQALAPQAVLRVITIGHSGSTLAIRDWLDDGGTVGLLGDRFLRSDPGRSGVALLPFLGELAPFSEGPLRLAMLLRRKVMFMAATYHGGNRYEVRFEPLADFTAAPAAGAEREAAVQAALRDYAVKLESLCRAMPYNWFNFHDFWRHD
ncbi:MAG: acyl-CoA synthetase [Rubrivivax sp.]